MQSFASHVKSCCAADLSIWNEVGIKSTVNGWRFAGAAVLYWLLMHSRSRTLPASHWRGNLWVGLFFSMGMLAQIIGLSYTRPSISGFLTALVVVFAPFAQSLFLKKPVRQTTWLAVVIATVGIVILAWPNPGAMPNDRPAYAPPLPFLGEGLTILGSLFFTAQLLTLDHFGKNADTTNITLSMFVLTALSGVLIGVVCAGREVYQLPVLQKTLSDTTLILAVMSLIVFSSIVAMHLMNVYQPRISAAMASVVYCLEPLFATLFSVLFGAEHLTLATFLGGGIILGAVLLVARKG